ncbi:uncharacterized protein V6R79_004107 [Siganus canaliculatus]
MEEPRNQAEKQQHDTNADEVVIDRSGTRFPAGGAPPPPKERNLRRTRTIFPKKKEKGLEL